LIELPGFVDLPLKFGLRAFDTKFHHRVIEIHILPFFTGSLQSIRELLRGREGPFSNFN
jgi:hypothetical protein